MSNPNDKVMTRPDIAKSIIERIDKKYTVSGTVLDPCRGEGAFFDNYPSDWQKDYCEIDNGKDFFQYTSKVDWIISNPPYSCFREWLNHSFTIADNIVYLIPIAKIVASKTLLKNISDFGGVVEIYSPWSGRAIGFPFGFVCGSVYLKKDHKEPALTYFNFEEK